jgi:predicted HTH transcriptional regulator
MSAVMHEIIVKCIVQDPERARGAKERIDALVANDPILSVRNRLSLPPDEDAHDREAILTFVKENPYFTGSEVAQQVRLPKGTAARLLAHLELAGLVKSTTGEAYGRSPRAILWSAVQ